MTEQIWWYATRAAGLMTWATAVTSIALGLVLSFSTNGRRRRWLPRKPWILDLHRFVGGMSVMFLALHMLTLWADDFVHFAWAELFIPGSSEWRPLAVAWGVVAAWLLIAIEGSSLLKNRLPNRLWRGIHLGSYLVAVLGTVHAISAGSDMTHPVVAATGATMLLIVVGLTIVRVITLRTTAPGAARSDQLEQARLLRDTALALENMEVGEVSEPVRYPSLADRFDETRARRPELSADLEYPPPAHRRSPLPQR